MIVRVGIKFNDSYKEFDVEEDELKNCLNSEFFYVINDNFTYIINTKNINYIIYEK